MGSSRSEPIRLIAFVCLVMAASACMNYFGCHGSVNVLAGDLLGPLKDYEGYTSLDTTAEEVQLHFVCTASYPTEWIFNYDDFDHHTHYGQNPTRHLPQDVDSLVAHIQNPNASYTYQSILTLRFQGQQNLFENEVRLICRSVFNHSDNVLVNLAPAEDGTEIDVTAHYGMALVGDKEPAQEKDSCNVTLMVAQIDGRTFMECQYLFGATDLDFEVCGTEAECWNEYRNEYRTTNPTCLQEVKVSDTHSNLAEEIQEKWKEVVLDVYTISFAVCVVEDSQPEIRLGAPIEFSFDGARIVNGNLDHKLHFSRFGVPMETLMWLDPPDAPLNRYTNEMLDTECVAPRYWFAWLPITVVTFNWTAVIHEARMEFDLGGLGWLFRGKIHLNLTEAGVYQVQCLAPVWNTTEWANYTTVLHVKDAKPPEFGESWVNVTFEENEMNAALVCDPEGDPVPTIITWDTENANLPGISINGNGKVLTFGNLSAEFENRTITCTAENEFGQRATKTFEVHIKGARDDEAQSPEAKGVATGTIVIIAGGFGSVLLFCILYAYYKFRKRVIVAYLTNEEEKEFREGKACTMSPEPNEAVVSVEYLPYCSEFEIRKEDFVVDFATVLGSGAYGIVYKGWIRRGHPIDAAVKTVRKNVPIDYFKALLSELKILAYIGPHDNIVNLIGAYTENIKNRELYVGVELCDKSLLQYLRDNQHTFLNKHASSYQNRVAIEDFWTFSTLDLIRWSGQIANGMEYLFEKRIVHGDLAARNVLLCFDRNIKICDFGLARQLIDYNYIKTKQCPLPWKWMAIESLTNMKFSTMSDVWAYGVTLWEIFSLGETPYAGLSWNLDFVDQLVNGLRMSRPAYADYEIFGIMTECWDPEPNARPSFDTLKQFFDSL